MTKRRLSSTQVRRFNECRWGWRKEYLENVDRPRIIPFERGSLVHGAIEAYIGFCLAHRLENAPQHVDAIWGAFRTTWLMEYGETIAEDLEPEGLQLLRKFAAQYRLDVDDTWMTEAPLACTWEWTPCEFTAPDAGLRGYADLVKVRGRRAWIDDWKVAWAPMKQQEMRDDLQARTYPLLLWILNPRLEEIIQTFWYVRSGVVRSELFTPADHQETMSRWVSLSDSVEAALKDLENADVWRATPGPHCSMCSVAHLCPMGLERIKQTHVVDLLQAEDLGLTILAADAGIKLLKDRLKAYCKTHGPVAAAGGRYGIWVYPGKKHSPHDLIRIAKQFFLEPTDLLKVDTDKLKKVGGKNRPFLNAVNAAAEDKVRTEFKWKKVTGEDADGQEDDEA